VDTAFENRAHKVDELHRNPNVEACWYFTGSREQYRLAGTARVVDKDTEDGELQKACMAQGSQVRARLGHSVRLR
jgi:hypothetical protein